MTVIDRIRTGLAPALAPVSARERFRATVGALLGLLVTGFVSWAAIGTDPALPLLIAPMGASAVLLFAVPSSPLAQPWSIVGGNLIAALVGVTAALWIPEPLVAGAVAAALAIGLMLAFRCVHPPSGAVALTAVLGGPSIAALGYGFVLWPVLGNTLLLLTSAMVYNTLTGRPYPHRARPATNDQTHADAGTRQSIGFTSADLDVALADYDQLLDVDRNDLESILRQAEMQAFRRRAGTTTCADIMSRDVIAVAPDTPLREALDVLRRHHVKALPVTDEKARVIGIVTQTDLLDKAAWDGKGPYLAAGRRFSLAVRRGKAPGSTVRDIMTSPARTARPEASIADIVPLMTTAGLHHLPIVDRHDQLVGVVTQMDMIAALLAQGTPAEADAQAA